MKYGQGDKVRIKGYDDEFIVECSFYHYTVSSPALLKGHVMYSLRSSVWKHLYIRAYEEEIIKIETKIPENETIIPNNVTNKNDIDDKLDLYNDCMRLAKSLNDDTYRLKAQKIMEELKQMKR